MNLKLLFQTLSKFSPISRALEEYITNNLTSLNLKAGGHMVNTAPVSQTLYFIEYGLVYGSKDIAEVSEVVWIAGQGGLIVPSPGKVEKQFADRINFLSPTLMIGLEIKFLYAALEVFPEAIDLFTGIIGYKLAEANSRELLLRQPSRQRYQMMFEGNPHLFLESNNEVLASFLNISTRQFTRIKSKFSKHQ